MVVVVLVKSQHDSRNLSLTLHVLDSNVDMHPPLFFGLTAIVGLHLCYLVFLPLLADTK